MIAVVAALLLGAAPAPAVEARPGLVVDVYARGLRRPTALAWGPGGLYATQEGGEVVAVARGTSRPRVVARGFRTPLGLVFRRREAWVSAQGAVFRLRLERGALVGRRTIVAGLPYGRHQQNNVVFGPGGRLFLGSGSTCDVCVERDPRAATILSFRPDGSGLRVEARGLRNPFGLVRRPGGDVFVSVNNQDDLGTWEPAETIVRLRRGAHYGWPRCWPSWRERRLRGSCAGVTAPSAYLEPHSSANGLAFWRGRLAVAEWGQYASTRFGRKVVEVDVATGRSRWLARGFDHPLALAVDPRGGLLVADWGRGVVYRLRRR